MTVQLTSRRGAPGKAYLLALPAALWVSTAGVFWLAAQALGQPAGYLLGFAFYWLFWCLAVPRLLLGPGGWRRLVTDQAPLFSRANWPAALLWVIVTGVAVLMYGQKFVAAPGALILIAIPVALFSGFCEEGLWRGLYVSANPRNPWLGILYPAAGFAVWHLAPQMIYPAANVPAFILSTLCLGLAYGFIAYRTGSARWTAFSHGLNGILALAGPLGQVCWWLCSRGGHL